MCCASVSDIITDKKEMEPTKGLLERLGQQHKNLLDLVAEKGLPPASKLTCTFFTLRMRDAWLQKSSLLELMFQKAAAEEPGEDLAWATADIGSAMLAEKTYSLAIKWLQRAFDVLNRIEATNLSDLGSELRMQTAHRLGSMPSLFLDFEKRLNI